jgi:hypothetical protein
MAQRSFTGEFREGDFADQVRLDPMRPAKRGSRHFDRRLGDFDGLHPLAQILNHPSVEPCSDFPGVAQLAPIFRRQVQ